MMRVGVLAHQFIASAGGVDFLRTVVSSLICAPAALEVHILMPIKGPRLVAYNALRRGYRSVSALLGHGYVPLEKVEHRHLTELTQSFPFGVTFHEIDYGNAAITTSVRDLGLNVLIPAIKPFPEQFPVPWVGYIYDFQHRYFPEYFTHKEFAGRDAAFRAMLNQARSVIVNAKDVAEDILKFHPNSSAEVFSLPFSAAPQRGWLRQPVPAALYEGADRPYFIICNQFWKHKDHSTAFIAFSKLIQKYPDINLICTGPTTDHRDRSYFISQQNQLVDLEIDASVHVLGMIPKSDQIYLLKNAIALVQPTLFEGGPGGGAVFDAVSLGVKCIVSDIAVNREIDEKDIIFFTAGDSNALAKVMIDTIENQSTQQRDDDMLIRVGKERRQRCGSVLLAAIDAAVGNQ